MPPSKYRCALCEKTFYGKQKFLDCTSCDERFHCGCLKISDDEYVIYKQGAFKCTVCLTKPRISNDDTPVRKSASASLPSTEADSDRTVIGHDLISCFESMLQVRMDHMVQLLTNEIGSLRELVSQLISKNTDLKSVIVELKSAISIVARVSVQGTPSSTRTNSGKKTKKVSEPESVVDKSSCAAEESQSISPLKSTNCVSANEENPSTRFENSSWCQVVGRRQRRTEISSLTQRQPEKKKGTQKCIIGRGAADSSMVVKRTKALFVTRFNPGVKEEDISQFLKSINITTAVATQLKTKDNN